MLNNIGLPGLLLIAVVVLVLFGRGKISSLMGEVGKGITAFKRGVSDGDKEYDEQRRAETEGETANRAALTSDRDADQPVTNDRLEAEKNKA
ncbi:Sec-independent protein translocase TatA [Mesobaculum littorinae]|uniref:Sec-independent protein translocase protein TatA n=1 Tax=Mesobaculum littorinae TaxID=2486419 RepID=A0A438AM68_9RHOB|nr:twin-arginine translocase TatA/TatE family subunit [Mesobaculum littorinae]RVV99782.1 Sec-independent protein translocase TatA [Mesobaculum littorinae]